MKFMSRSTPDQKRAVLLWIVQGLLALVFLFTGGMKAVCVRFMPTDFCRKLVLVRL
jgi:hypothetical protein